MHFKTFDSLAAVPRAGLKVIHSFRLKSGNPDYPALLAARDANLLQAHDPAILRVRQPRKSKDRDTTHATSEPLKGSFQ